MNTRQQIDSLKDTNIRKIAMKTGINPTTLWRQLNGHTALKYDTIEKLVEHEVIDSPNKPLIDEYTKELEDILFTLDIDFLPCPAVKGLQSKIEQLIEMYK